MTSKRFNKISELIFSFKNHLKNSERNKNRNQYKKRSRIEAVKQRIISNVFNSQVFHFLHPLPTQISTRWRTFTAPSRRSISHRPFQPSDKKDSPLLSSLSHPPHFQKFTSQWPKDITKINE